MLLRLAFIAMLLTWPHAGSKAASALVLPGDAAAVIAAEDGYLQLWEKGAKLPKWKLKIGGFGVGARSRVAAMARRPSGEILVVERSGAIDLVSQTGRLVSRKQPLYEYVQLRSEISEVDWSKWGSQIKELAVTAAATITADTNYIYLVGSPWSIVVKIPTDAFLRTRENLVSTSDSLVFQFADSNLTINRKTQAPSFTVSVRWSVGESLHATALAVCSGTMLAGTEEGRVAIAPEVGDRAAEGRLRVVASSNNEVRSILDAGCLGSRHAYTVSFDAGNGQIQLWDLATKAALDSVGLRNGGHPGMAFAAVASLSGSSLLSVGDGDIRLWKIEDSKLRLVAKRYPGRIGGERLFAAAALTGGGFLYWDGAHVLKVDERDGGLSYFAGPQSDDDAEVRQRPLPRAADPGRPP